jgi:hypothetical protein
MEVESVDAHCSLGAFFIKGSVACTETRLPLFGATRSSAAPYSERGGNSKPLEQRGGEAGVEWFWQKVDTFLAAAVLAMAGTLASQGQAFTVQYTQRLDGRLEEARAHLEDVQGGLRYRVMGDEVRAELESQARQRVAVLQRAHDAVAEANVFTRPIVIFRHGEEGILGATWRDFAPALPLDADSAIYIVVGLVTGFLLYEVIKFPIVLIAREPRRRRFRRRI